MEQLLLQLDIQQSDTSNTLELCKKGRIVVQDIFYTTRQLFKVLKEMQTPQAGKQSSESSSHSDNQAKVEKLLKNIQQQFQWVRFLYEKCNLDTQVNGMEYAHVESLIPLKDDVMANAKQDEAKNTDAYNTAKSEYDDLKMQAVLKNEQLKEVINHMRRTIWEINTLLAMKLT